jgi:hypothetical protein
VTDPLPRTFYRELSDRLGMSREEGERWIVDLVRDARLDAKIDFKEVSLRHWSRVNSWPD